VRVGKNLKTTNAKTNALLAKLGIMVNVITATCGNSLLAINV